MKILYIHQYFITPNQPGGTRSYWFSKELLKKGYEVTMLTSRNNQKKIIERENIDGIDVIYIRNRYDNNFSVIRRIISFVKFMIISTYCALFEKNVSLIYASSTPLTIGFPALLCKLIKNKEYLFEVRDLWPEVPIQMKAIKNIFVKNILVNFEKNIYKKALHIIALSPGMKEGVIEKGVDENKVTMIPNMSKNNEFFKREKNVDLMIRLQLKPENFHAIHFGAMGIANGLNYILDAAKIIQQKDFHNIRILFAGRGRMEKELKERIKEENINNVQFLGSFAMEQMSEIVNIADCSIITFQNLPILRTNSPNKLFDSLSAEKPIIVNSAGWTKDLVEKNKCGAYVSPDCPSELANIIINWSENRSVLKEMGDNALKLGKIKFDKSILCNQFVNIINEHV